MGKAKDITIPHLHQVAELTPAITSIYCLQTGKYLYLNNGIHTILGYRREPFLENGMPFTFSFIHPDDMLHVQKEFRSALGSVNSKSKRPRIGKPLVTVEYRMKHKNGSWRWLQTSVAVFRRDSKGKVEQIVSTSVDVTDLKEERLKMEEKLRQSEEKYRVVVENSRDVILTLNMQGKVTYVSPANEKIFGFRPEESIGSFAFDWVHPEDKPQMLKAFHNVTKSIGRVSTYRAKHKDGHYIPVEGMGTLVFDDKKKPTMIVGTVRDITLRRQLEKQKDTFIAIASHELKTPVTSLKAFAQVLQSQFKKDGDEKSALYLAKMNQQLDKLTHLINDLLDVTKVESGKLKFKKERFDFNELLSEIIEEMQRTTKKHTIVKKLRKSPLIYGDRERIGQVVTNLLSNAIKYSPDSSQIIVITKVGKTAIITSVQDFGMGISEENQKRVFERFFRGTENKHESYPGLGLGLFIASEIVKRHEGTIGVKSKNGKGTTFHFSLPHAT